MERNPFKYEFAPPTGSKSTQIYVTLPGYRLTDQVRVLRALGEAVKQQDDVGALAFYGFDAYSRNNPFESRLTLEVRGLFDDVRAQLEEHCDAVLAKEAQPERAEAARAVRVEGSP